MAVVSFAELAGTGSGAGEEGGLVDVALVAPAEGAVAEVAAGAGGRAGAEGGGQGGNGEGGDQRLRFEDVEMLCKRLNINPSKDDLLRRFQVSFFSISISFSCSLSFLLSSIRLSFGRACVRARMKSIRSKDLSVAFRFTVSMSSASMPARCMHAHEHALGHSHSPFFLFFDSPCAVKHDLDQPSVVPQRQLAPAVQSIDARSLYACA